MFSCTGSPVTPFADAIKAVLAADATLMALITDIYGAVPEDVRTPYPYLVLGRTTDDGASGAMAIAGGVVTLQLDGWSDAKGPYAMEAINSRVKALLERRPDFRVPGYVVLVGSLHCELSTVFDEPDEDAPDHRLWHGAQRWSCELHEAA